MSRLSEKEREEVKKCFSMFDKDGNGKISINELGTVMRALDQNPTNAQIKSVMSTLDTNGNGEVEFHEFFRFMEEHKKTRKEECNELLEAFRILDRDKNGYITGDELIHAMTSFGERLTKEESEAMVKEADINGDGRIAYDEFCAVMTRKH